jgi:hypothetical protein
VEPEHTSIARQRLGKYIPAAMNTHSSIKEPVSKQRIGKQTKEGVLLEMVFSVRSVQNCYKEDFSSEYLLEFRSFK